MIIKKSTINFLEDLSNNNDREWFKANKNQYTDGLEDFKSLAELITSRLNEIDEIEKTKIYRIYRDVRFSKDKTPYKTNFSASFSRLGKYRRGGFFLSISPKESFVAGGFWQPNKDDMKYIRDGITDDAQPIIDAVNNETFKERFGQLFGEQLKSAPRGYAKDDPNIYFLRFKQFLVKHDYALSEVMKPTFVDEVIKDYQAMLPLFDAIRDYVLFDANGVERE